ncbi:glycosyltransferase [Halalkalibacter kiskunsagensis]|uniref:Glycosyltransferase n=1 Tax=Halalkalibacter kiskunsagensis TaxID=1548599 RepID=A0ABV6KDF1_9BACI
MNILYIPSGYGQIYQSFDQSILKAFKELGHQVKCVPSSGEEALKNAVKFFQPDIALTLTGFKMAQTVLDWLKNQGIKLAVWMTEDPYYIDRTINLIPHYDYVFTIDTAALEVYKETGHKQVHFLPLGTDPDIYFPTSPIKDFESDICLVGYPYPNRTKMIQFLTENTNFSILVVGSQWTKKLTNLKQSSRLCVHSSWVPPTIAKNYYNSAIINLNTHRPYNLKQNKNKKNVINQCINNRTFDIASCGGFQLIEYKAGLPKHFINEEEIVSFNSNVDLLEKVTYYMSHYKERHKIAESAREKTINNHTFEHRMQEMLNIISNT